MRSTLLLAALSLCALAPTVQSQALTAERIAVGLDHPAMVLQAPGDNSRLFILERRTGIRILQNGVLHPGLFLDLSAELTNNEGITSFVFHPNYQSNGRFFLSYLDSSLKSHLVEYLVSANPDVADASSRIQILGPYQQISLIHNWNHLRFGPDGMLYFAVGEDSVGADSQDLSNMQGSILRMDIDIPPPYVPASGNPFVGQAGVDELIWMYGLREPWRFDIDPLNGDIYIGEVGAGAEEEIDVVSFASAPGSNFGWRCLEGNFCNGDSLCAPCSDPRYTPPVLTIPHTNGRCAVIGGIVYRGSALPSLQGTYWYSEFCTSKIYSFVWDGTQVTQHVDRTAELIPSIGGPIDFVASFSRDNAGEMYICSNSGGEVYKIVPSICGVSNYCSSNPNTAGTSASIGSSGSTSIAAQDFGLVASAVLPNKVGMFFYGPTQAQAPFGDGLRCVGGGINRMNPASVADSFGNNTRAVDYAVEGITAGDVLNFQYWYRDSASPNLFNLSDGLAVGFCP